MLKELSGGQSGHRPREGGGGFYRRKASLGAKRTVATGDVLSSKISKRVEGREKDKQGSKAREEKIVISLFGLESGSASHVQGDFQI